MPHRFVGAPSAAAFRILAALLVIVCLLTGAYWLRRQAKVPSPTVQGEPAGYEPARTGNEPLQPIGPARGLDPGVVTLGRDLFFDPRLSADHSISCANCHDLDRGGADGLVHSVGIRGAIGSVNAPTVLNSALNFRQFWNGRAGSLEEQAGGPIENPTEMGSSLRDAIASVRSTPDYARRFGRCFADGVTGANLRTAIATYERSLLTPSRFDRFLLGDATALDEREKRGYSIFKNYGCVSCHQGRGIGGNMYQTFGVMADYFADRGNVTAADEGRFAVTHDPADLHVFKVPSLRNVALTAPYFHDGSAPTLPSAIRIMGRYQLGRDLTPDEIADLAAFLGSLTGSLPAGARLPVPAVATSLGR